MTSKLISLIQLLAHLTLETGLCIRKTKGSNQFLNHQMTCSGLKKYFNDLFAFKLQANTYHHVLNEMNFKVEGTLRIPSHPWNIAGVEAVGIHTAFIERKGQIYYPLMDTEDIQVNDLTVLAENL